MQKTWDLRWSPFSSYMIYLFVLLMVLISIVQADLENVDEPQPKRGNALLSRYGRAVLSRYGKRSMRQPINPPPYISDDRVVDNKGGWLLCQEGMNNDLVRCFPFSKH